VLHFTACKKWKSIDPYIRGSLFLDDLMLYLVQIFKTTAAYKLVSALIFSSFNKIDG
jgi:hypothetical protein